MKTNHICDSATFFCEDGSMILFTYQCFSGMVGECVESIRAQSILNVLCGEGSKLDRVDLSYEDLRKTYRAGMKNAPKSQRIAFWRWMRSMSPEAQQQRLEDQTAEAISRVI